MFSRVCVVGQYVSVSVSVPRWRVRGRPAQDADRNKEIMQTISSTVHVAIRQEVKPSSSLHDNKPILLNRERVAGAAGGVKDRLKRGAFSYTNRP